MFWGVCAEWLLAGRDGRKPARAKGFAFEDVLPPHKCTQTLREAVTSAARYTGPTAGHTLPWKRRASLLGARKNRTGTSAAPSKESFHRKFTWCVSPIWRPLLSDTFFSFCFVSRAFLNSFQGRASCRVRQAPVEGALSSRGGNGAVADTKAHGGGKSQQVSFCLSRRNQAMFDGVLRSITASIT